MSTEKIMDYIQFTYDFVKSHADSIDWEQVSTYAPIDVIEEIMVDYPDDIKWWKISRRSDLTVEFVRKYSDNIKWTEVSRHLNMEVLYETIEGHCYEINWNWISLRKIPEWFVRKYSQHIVWFFFSKNDHFTDYSSEFFEEFSELLDWHYILGPKSPFSDEFKKTQKEKLKIINL